MATIEYGEETGHMDQVLARLADDVERQTNAANTLVSALVYPAIMIVVAVSIVVLLMIYVVPQMTEVFAGSKQELPALTTSVIVMSDFLRHYGNILLLIIIVSIVGLLVALTKPAFRIKWDKWCLQLPALGHWIILSQLSRWARSLGMLMGSGVPSMQALNIASRNIQNRYLESIFKQVIEAVREGVSLHQALTQHKVFPGFIIHMVSAG